MGSSMITAKRTSPVKEIVDKMRAKGATCAVILDKKSPVGIFSDKDLLPLLDSSADLSKTTVESAMQFPIITVGETQDLFTAIRRAGMVMAWNFAVVDAENRIKGLITDADIIDKYALRSFPYNLMLAAFMSNGLTAAPKSTLRAVVKMMVAGRQNCVTILQNRKPVGILDSSQFLKFTSKAALKAEAGKKMSKKMATAVAQGSAREAVIKMVKMKQPVIVVTDEKGFYAGIVTRQSLASHVEKTQL